MATSSSSMGSGESFEELVLRIAQEWRLITSQQIEEARETQARIARVGTERTLLDILQDRGILTAEQLDEIKKHIQGGRRRRLGKYELLEKLGGGGIGAIYRARELNTNRVVAIKILRLKHELDDRYLAMFEREAEVVSRLDHPNIVKGFEGGWGKGYRYFVMEYVHGESLQKLLKKVGRLPAKHVMRIAEKIGLALEHLGEFRLVHCDIKPGNILIRTDGVIKLTDWGAVRLLDESGRAPAPSELVLVTPNFMAPEMVRKGARIDARADIYSLGATLYCALTGRLPFEGSSIQQIVCRLLADPPPSARALVPEVPESLDRFIQHAMAKNPAERPRDAKEFLKELKEVAAGQRF